MLLGSGLLWSAPVLIIFSIPATCCLSPVHAEELAFHGDPSFSSPPHPHVSNLQTISTVQLRVVSMFLLCCPAGLQELLSLVPKLMLKLQEEEEEEIQLLLLSTLTSCSRLDPVPLLAADGVSLLRLKLLGSFPSVRREAAAAMMALWCVSRGDA